MPTFNVPERADELAITLHLADDTDLRSRDLLPEVVDALFQAVNDSAQLDAADEAKDRTLRRQIEEATEKGDDTQFEAASKQLIELISANQKRDRALVYDRLAIALQDSEGKRRTAKELRGLIPFPIAREVNDALTRLLLGRGGESGNAAGSDGSPTPTGSTSAAQS